MWTGVRVTNHPGLLRLSAFKATTQSQADWNDGSPSLTRVREGYFPRKKDPRADGLR